MSVLVLGSCANERNKPFLTDVGDQKTEVTQTSAVPSSGRLFSNRASNSEPRQPVAKIFRGSGGPDYENRFVRRSATVNPAGDITLNFLNSDVADIAKAVLGDILKLNYIIAPGVRGVMTIHTSRPISRAAVIPTLESAFRLNGLAIVKNGAHHRIVNAADAPRHTNILSDGMRRNFVSGGFGIEIVPLQFIGAQKMQQLLATIIPKGSILEVNKERNLLIVGGTHAELRSILNNIELFDVDWLKEMSFGLYSPRTVEAGTLMKELEQLMGGPLEGVVRFVLIERLNAVLAISQQPKYLEDIETWVKRLDRSGSSSEQRLFVYRVQHRRAKDLAAVLQQALGAIDTTDPTVVAESQILPGATVTGLPKTVTPAPKTKPTQPVSKQSLTTGAKILMSAAEGVSVAGLKSIRITADEVDNSLVILTGRREFEVIKAALRELDTVPLQVLIEAVIIEVSLTNDLKYGVQFFVRSGSSEFFRTDSASSNIVPTLPGFASILRFGPDITTILSMIESVTRLKVLSSPQLMVLNNQTATLQVGDQVPIATSQATGVAAGDAPIVNTIQFKDTGIILKITPRVNQGGMVQLDITQEVSDVSATTSSTLNSPTIRERKFTTSVAIQNGTSIALGGLIKDSRGDSNDGIPILKDIPYLGALFRTTEDRIDRTELIVLITPHVVESTQKAISVTEELRRKLPATRILFNAIK